MNATAIAPAGRPMRALAAVFCVSGAAALVYQVCWQRLLFQAFGVDLESVTIIVSAFMLGLGVGALLGGQVADRYPDRALDLFAAVELGIGAFGLFSPELIGLAGDRFVASSPWTVATVNFLLLLVPTTLMGATLPILVAHVTRAWGSVGEAIGMLYFVNTLGATAGAALVGFAWLWLFDLDHAVRTAAIVNMGLSLFIRVRLGRETRHG